jgi:molybdopterin/thiamine biosynthesis adenylyltransferase
MQNALSRHIQAAVQKISLGDGTPCLTIRIGDVERIAQQMRINGRQVEIAALRDKILPDRYLRNLKTLSITDQLGLLESAVGVIGLGGLGGLVSETLARMGIGCLHLIDGDVFESHNLNRQLLSRIDTMGTMKADQAAMRIKSINPGIEVISTGTFLTAENADTLLCQCDLVVDCLDNIQSRFILQAAARQAGIPMVSAAIAGLSGHITTVFPEDKGLEVIYGPLDQLKITKGAETHLGCLATAVNLMASLECSETVKVLLGKGHTLRNAMLMVDLTDYTFEALRLC